MPDKSKNLRFTTDWRTVEMDAFYGVYDSVGFGLAPGVEIPSNFGEKLFPPGGYGFFAFDDDRLVGCSRVLSDDLFCSFIAEICVHPDWQGHGIGSALLGMINARFPHTGLFVSAFNGQESFFEGRGLRRKPKLTALGRRPIPLAHRAPSNGRLARGDQD